MVKHITYILFFIFFLYGCRIHKKNDDILEKNIVDVSHNSFQDDLFIVEDFSNFDFPVSESIVVEFEESMPEQDNPITDKLIGTLTYKIDSIFVVNTISRVEARIIKLVNDTISDYLISITHKSNSGRIISNRIRVGDVMDMELVSLDETAFEISEISPDNQPVDDQYVATWLWSVKPIKSGEYNLILKAYIKEGNSVRYNNVFDEIITVKNKPKKNYVYDLEVPSEIKKYNSDLIILNIYESTNDEYDFKWGGSGEILLEFDKNIDINIISDDLNFNSNKNNFRYRWSVQTNSNIKKIDYSIKIVGDYDSVEIDNGSIKIKNNIWISFNNFIDEHMKRWYFIFTSLLIPLYFYVKKKYFKKKEDSID
jgi:hypothetical protein